MIEGSKDEANLLIMVFKVFCGVRLPQSGSERSS